MVRNRIRNPALRKDGGSIPRSSATQARRALDRCGTMNPMKQMLCALSIMALSLTAVIVITVHESQALNPHATASPAAFCCDPFPVCPPICDPAPDECHICHGLPPDGGFVKSLPAGLASRAATRQKPLQSTAT